MDESLFPVGKLVGLEFLLQAEILLRQATGSPVLNVLLPKRSLLFKFL